jgi:hypothetical protein
MSAQDSVAVFLGPTLPRSRAREILEATYYPPARKGDIYRVMTSGVETIVLIDGVFHNTPSVWQRELLDAIEEGFSVFGASSMGALRAAELHPLGMIGYGVVFEWYRDGVIEGDDEVALLHATDEFDYRALSVPMVNIRYTLAQAVRDRVLTAEQETGLLDYVKNLPYPERSFRAVLRDPSLLELSPEALSLLQNYFSGRAVDIKMRDAVGLLHHVKATRGAEKRAPRITTARTSGVTKQHYERLLMTGFHAPHGLVEGAEVLRRALANKPFAENMRAALSARRFILEWINQNQVSCPASAVEVALDQFKSNHGIPDFAAWLRRNGLTYASFAASLSEIVSVDWVIMKGAADFGLDWSAAATSVVESLAASDPHAFQQALVLDCLPRADGVEMAADTVFSKNRSYSQYGFIIEWAKQNGITVADACLMPEQPLEAGRNSESHVAAPSVSQTAASHRARRRELLLAAWVVKQGPGHFGLDWIFELDLLRALQMTDQVERLCSVTE